MSAPGKGFYITGGTLRHDAPCYVERQADHNLYDGLGRGEFCYVLTARQMGKSSLMVRTAARLQEEGIAVVMLDLTAVGQNVSAEQWYDGLLRLLGQQVDLETELDRFWMDQCRLGPLQRWMAALQQVVLSKLDSKGLVIFVDEIDAVRSLPFSTDEFFAAIRECYNRRSTSPEFARLTFCLLGVATPSDLIRDTRTTPFNIGRRIELHDFSEQDAAPLARGLGREQLVAADLLRRVLYWTNGHPYLTQHLCQAIAQDSNVRHPRSVDQACQELFLSSRAKERDDNLLFVRERLVRNEGDLASLLHLYEKVLHDKQVPDDPTNPLINSLGLSGIARVVDGRLRLRNRIYREVFNHRWVQANMPDAEARRQKQAFRRGFLRAAAVGTVIVAALSGLLWYARRQAERADRNAREEARQRRIAEEKEESAQLNLYIGDMNLARQAWEDSNFGRARDLLERNRRPAGRKDFRAWEWRYLWHVCRNDELTTLGQHDTRLLSVAFSPDGKTVASGSEDGAIKLWDVAGQKQIGEFKHKRNACGLAFSPQGDLLASASTDGTARLWDLQNAREAHQFPHPTWVKAAVFSPDGKTLATLCGDGRVRLWNVEGRTNTGTWTVGGAMNASLTGALTYSANGRLLAAAHESGEVRVLDLTTRRALGPMEHGKSVSALGFSPDGQTLVSGGWDHSVRVWDLATGEAKVRLTNHVAWICAALFSPDGGTLATAGADQMVRLWDVNTWEEITTLKGHTSELGGMAFSPDGLMLVTGAKDHTVKLWSAIPRRQEISRFGLPAGLPDWGVSPNGRTLLSWKPDGTVILTDALSFRRLALHNLSVSNLSGVSVTADRRWLALATRDGSLKLWDLKANCVSASLVETQGVPLRYPVFSPNGKILAAGPSRKAITLWDTARQQPIAPIDWAKAETKLVFSADSEWIGVGGSDGSVKVWHAATGREDATFAAHQGILYDLAFSPDGRFLATAGEDGYAMLFDRATGKTIARLRASLLTVSFVTFSPDGQRLVTGGGGQRSIKLWEVTTQQEVLALRGLQDRVSQAFFADDQTLVAFGASRFLRLKAATLAEADTPSESISNTGANTPDDWLDHADQLLNRGRFPDAVQAMDRAISLQPQDATLWLNKALMLENANRLQDAVPAFDQTIDLALRSTNQWSEVLSRGLLHRSGVFKRLRRFTEAAADYARANGIPVREPGISPDFIDLTLYYNVGLDEDFRDIDKPGRTNSATLKIYNLSALPRGLTRLDSVQYDLRGAILLTSSKLREFHVNCPEQITNIPITRVCKRVHFLHAAGWPVSAGTSIGAYLLHFADGHEEELPIVYGQTVDNCVVSTDAEPRARESSLAWTGTNTLGTVLRLFHTAWDNPRPDVAIERMDYVSYRTKSAPVLIAVTTEP